MRWILLLPLLGCNSGKIGGDDTGGATDGGATDGGATDGGTTDGGGTDGGTTDGGTTDGGTTDGGTASESTFIFVVDGDLGGRTLGFAELSELISEDYPGFEQALDGLPLSDAEVPYSPGDLPDGATMWQLDPEGWPGWEVALYMPFVFEDGDGDGVLGGDEVITGAGSTWIAWMEAPLPSEVISLGFEEGWNALVMQDDAFPERADRQAVAVAQALAPVESATLSGSYEGSAPIGQMGLAVLAGSELAAGEPVGARYADQAMTAEWSVTLDGTPPADHYADLEGTGTGELQAAEVIVGYRDVDSSGDLDIRVDPVLHGACSGGDVVVGVWVEPITDLSIAWGATFSGYGTGWQFIATGDVHDRLVSGAELSSLVMDDDCQLGD